MSLRIAFFGAQSYDINSFEEQNKEFNYDLRFFTGNLNQNNIVLTKDADAVCIFVNDLADRQIIKSLSEYGVKLLALRCAGYNNVDLKAAHDYGITVVRVPAYSPYAVAEHTVALMLALNRRIPRATWRTRDGNFSLNGLLGFDMHGKTAGIIGTGKIAKILIQILRGFGVNILAYDPYPDHNFARDNRVVYTSLDQLYHSSDIISLHCPLTEDTKYLINDYSISKMKDGVMIINTGRGQLIHTNALIDGLKNKKVGWAGLDVYEEENEYFYQDKSESIIDDDVLARLLSFNNVIVTSHQAFFTKEALRNIAHTTLQNIKAFSENKKLVNVVELPDTHK
ncbi:MAG: 2-hydroxyacid dehydrogenase [Bacteroides sp.]|nr:2-hydroxyacid dehydrogenase [Bacteroides sp.]MDD2646262.1 2-hydroxyacid dehydrogenase [Bacteroides sp.]MDD4055372.1 2-hydroxyacid dehydrogenase [Bacteroides sp.]MDD4720998.1 2-hydroxyacid dehydrogenase [Bacteroides sp.]NLI64069.1 2-hydroxyacid dehydrogenase [Bacteroidales bacterium]